jgi:hypothetical protein
MHIVEYGDRVTRWGNGWMSVWEGRHEIGWLTAGCIAVLVKYQRPQSLNALRVSIKERSGVAVLRLVALTKAVIT